MKLQNGKAINVYKLVKNSGSKIEPVSRASSKIELVSRVSSKIEPVILGQKQGSAGVDQFKKRTEPSSFFELKQDTTRKRTTTTAAVAGKDGVKPAGDGLRETEAVVAGFYRSKNINRRSKSKGRIADWATEQLKRHTVRQIIWACNECQWADDPARINMRLDNMPHKDDLVKDLFIIFHKISVYCQRSSKIGVEFGVNVC